MIFKPQNKAIAKHIDHYWIVENSKNLLVNLNNLHAYPGITPDMIIVLDGFYEFNYLGKKISQNKSMLFSFIHNEIQINLSSLNSFILVKFKPRVLGAIKPFVNYSSEEIMQNPIGFSESAFEGTISDLPKLLKNLSEIEVIDVLDNWFLSYYKKEREGFIIEMAEEVCPNFDLSKIMKATKYSYSTIERHFKRETGLTPKKFQSLKRFKDAVTEICITNNNDWMKYVTDYSYYDQAHFIKDIKKHSKFTPNQLLNTSNLLSLRP